MYSMNHIQPKIDLKKKYRKCTLGQSNSFPSVGIHERLALHFDFHHTADYALFYLE